jgi:hypothetical protein
MKNKGIRPKKRNGKKPIIGQPTYIKTPDNKARK